MSDIFISYSRADLKQAETLAHALEAEGWSVWSDRSIPAGRAFDEVIEEAIDHSNCVMVLWSSESIDSQWVRSEAQEGLDRHILIPVQIEDVKIPLAFRRIQAARFVNWNGQPSEPAFRSLVNDIAGILGDPPNLDVVGPEADTSTRKTKLPSPAGKGQRPTAVRNTRSTARRHAGLVAFWPVVLTPIFWVVVWMLGLAMVTGGADLPEMASFAILGGIAGGAYGVGVALKYPLAKRAARWPQIVVYMFGWTGIGAFGLAASEGIWGDSGGQYGATVAGVFGWFVIWRRMRGPEMSAAETEPTESLWEAVGPAALWAALGALPVTLVAWRVIRFPSGFGTFEISLPAGDVIVYFLFAFLCLFGTFCGNKAWVAYVRAAQPVTARTHLLGAFLGGVVGTLAGAAATNVYRADEYFSDMIDGASYLWVVLVAMACVLGAQRFGTKRYARLLSPVVVAPVVAAAWVVGVRAMIDDMTGGEFPLGVWNLLNRPVGWGSTLAVGIILGVVVALREDAILPVDPVAVR